MASNAAANTVPISRRPSALESWIVILGFCLFIITPGLLELAGVQTGASENGAPAQQPSLPQRLDELAKLPQQTQAYLDERFGLRSQMVRLNSLIHYALNVSTTPKVALGRHGFMFYAYEPERIMEQHTGEDVFSQTQLEDWVAKIAADETWLAERGIAFYVVVAPDKSTIYPEDLPDYPALPNSTTRFDQVVEAVADHRDITLIDPRAAIKALKPQHGMYTRTDSHWGPRGAFVAYKLLMEQVGRRFPNVQPVSLDDYEVSSMHFRGDLALLMNMYNDIIYPEDYLKYRGASHIVSTTRLPPQPGSGWGITEVRTDRQDSPRILIQGDSFTDYVMGPLFLYETFKDPVYIHHNGTVLDKPLIEKTHPDIVVLELAERYLSLL